MPLLEGFGSSGLLLTEGFGGAYVFAPFSVVQAYAVESNLIRVRLSKEPVHTTPLGLNDAWNRKNWLVTILSGAATAPVITAVERVELTEDEGWIVELRTAMRVVAPGTVFATIAQPTLAAVDGELIAGAPADRWSHPGIVLARPRSSFRRPVAAQGIDLRFDPVLGRWILDARGDVDVEFGSSALAKRILRRLITPPAGFYHLPFYGSGMPEKKLERGRRTQQIRADMLEQVRAEEGVHAAGVDIEKQGQGTWIVRVKVQTQFGPLELAVETPADS